MKNFVGDWKLFLADRKNKRMFILSLAWVIALLFSFSPFFSMIEHRSGYQLHDWLLSKIPCFDLSWIIFSLIYFVVFAGFFSFIVEPELFSRALFAYAILTTLRLLMIYFVKLEPPVGIIPLKDPFFNLVLAPKEVVNKDLFFSGHTSTVVLFALMIKQVWLKKLFILFSVLVPVLILFQHVHYTIDVALAPFFAYYAYRIAFFKKEAMSQINQEQKV